MALGHVGVSPTLSWKEVLSTGRFPEEGFLPQDFKINVLLECPAYSILHIPVPEQRRPGLRRQEIDQTIWLKTYKPASE